MQSPPWTEWLGWASSLILVLTLARQLRKQIREQTSRGVSKWLYIGQFAAEIGFVIYSWALRNWIFVFTNAALLLENTAGLIITLRQRKQQKRAESMRLSGKVA